MAYRLSYSDYVTASGPPDPAAWVGPPGPPGPVGPQGPQGQPQTGGPFLPISYTATGGTTSRSAYDRAADIANVLDYGADPTGVADSSTAFNAAAAHISPATGKRVSVYAPSGKYRINQQVVLTDGQSLMGDGAGTTMLYISEQLDPAATSIIKCTPSVTDPGPVISDIMMWFEQPIDATSRATFKTLAAGGTSHNGGTGVQYPWAIATDTLNVRISVRNVSIAGSWNGIEANKAVFWIDGLKISAFNIGISIGGTAAAPVADWAHLSDIEFWVFGLNTTALQNIYMDGQTIAMQIGAQNGLTCQNISCFTSRLVFTSDASAGWCDFTNLAMDTGQATIEVTNCFFLQITNLYTTAAADAVKPLVSIAGTGRTIITNWYGHNSSPHQMLSVSGGDVTLVGAFFLPYDSTSDVVSVLSTGILRMSSSKIYPTGSGAWTRPVINQYDTSRLQVNDIDVIGDATSGTAVQFNTDVIGNRCGNIAMPTGWRRIVAPNTSNLGRYGDVFPAPLDSSSIQVGSFGFMRFGATAHHSTAIGSLALDQHLDGGAENTAVGFLAGYNVGSGTYNSFFGSQSGYGPSGLMSGVANACFGATSGMHLSTGISNTFLGTGAGATVATGSGNIFVGRDIDAAAATSNTINIGNIFTASGINTPATSTAALPGSLNVDGSVQAGTPTGGAAGFVVFGAAGAQKSVQYYRGSNVAWGLMTSGATDDFAIGRWNDSGVFQGAPLTINRATGAFGALTVSANPTATTAQLSLSSLSGTFAVEAKQYFYGTFPTSETVAYLAASLRAGLSAYSWTASYLDVWLTNAAQNVPSDTNMVRVARFTPAGMFLPQLPASASYANDAAAATGGVAVGQLYRNGSAVMVRVA